ncbi:sugar kinase [Leifsonia naganoensis]
MLAAMVSAADVPLDAASAFTLSFAGAESNTAVGLARLGIGAEFVGRVGDDAIGRAAVRFLRGEGVGTDGVTVDPAPTGILVRSASSSGRTEVVYGRTRSAGSRLQPGDLDLIDWTDVGAAHVSGITAMLSASAHDTVTELFRRAEARAALTSFDPNLRLRLAPLPEWRRLSIPFARRADIVLVGADELLALTGEEQTDDAVAALWTERSRFVVVKDGPRGARAWDGTAWTVVETLPVPTVDPVGAGDAFDASFLAGLLRGRGLAMSLDEACRAGALVAQTPGDTAGLPREPVSRHAGDVDR